jgi:hypothetical protein
VTNPTPTGPDDRWERIERIQGDRWVPNPVSDEALQRARLAVCTAGRLRTKALLFWGAPNAGKSALRTKILREIEANILIPGRATPLKVIEVEAPSEADEGRFFEAVLEAGHRFVPSGNVRTLQRAVTAMLRDLKPDVMILDEAGNLNAYTGMRGTVCLNAIRRLCNRHRFALLGFGTATAMTALRADEQLENRFEAHELRVLDNSEFEEFVLLYTGSLPLNIETQWTPAMLDRAYGLTEGSIGRAAFLVQESASMAILSGDEQITEAILNSDELAASLAALAQAHVTAGGRRRRRRPRG